MKKLLIALGVLLLLCIIGLGIAAYSAESLVKKYKPDLEQIASDALKAPVALGDIGVSVFPSAKVAVSQLTIGKTASAPGLQLKDLLLRVNLFALLGGSLQISELSLDSPSIVLRKDSSGVQIEGLAKDESGREDAAKKRKAKSAEDREPPASKKSSTTASSPLDLSLDLLSIENVQLTLRDVVQKKEYVVSGVDVVAAAALEGSQVKLKSLKIDAKDALIEVPGALRKASGQELWLGTKNIEFGEKLSVPDLKLHLVGSELQSKLNYEFGSKRGSLEIGSASGINISSVAGLLTDPAVSQLDLKGTVQPQLAVQLAAKPSASFKGTLRLKQIAALINTIQLSGLAGEIALEGTESNQQLRASSPLSFSLNDVPATLVLQASNSPSRADVESFELKGFGGNLSGGGRLHYSSQGFAAKLAAVELKIADALRALAPQLPIRVTGLLTSAKADITGTLGSDVAASLRGKTSLAVVNGEIKEVNLAAEVLREVTELPFLRGSLLDSVPEEERKELQSADTKIKELKLVANIANSSLQIVTMKLISSIFAMQGKGLIGFDGSLNLSAKIVFSKAFSTALATKTREVQKILNRDGQLVIPLKIKGSAGKVRVLPDTTQLLKMAAKGALKEKAGNLLGEVLGEQKNKAGKKAGGLGGLLGF